VETGEPGGKPPGRKQTYNPSADLLWLLSSGSDDGKVRHDDGGTPNLALAHLKLILLVLSRVLYSASVVLALPSLLEVETTW